MSDARYALAAAYVRKQIEVFDDDRAGFTGISSIAEVLDAGATGDPQALSAAVSAMADGMLAMQADEKLVDDATTEIQAEHDMKPTAKQGVWSCSCGASELVAPWSAGGNHHTPLIDERVASKRKQAAAAAS